MYKWLISWMSHTLKEEIQEHEATPEYHAYVQEMLTLTGQSAVQGSQEEAIESQKDQFYTTAASIDDILKAVRPSVPHPGEREAARNVRAQQGYPQEVNELLGQNERINVLQVEEESTKRFPLPPKGSCVSWDRLTHSHVRCDNWRSSRDSACLDGRT